MKKINWKLKNSGCCAEACVGGVSLLCGSIYTSKSKRRWYTVVSFGRMKRLGKIKDTLSEAKVEVVRLANELLLDFKVVVDKELKNFDLLEQMV